MDSIATYMGIIEGKLLKGYLSEEEYSFFMLKLTRWDAMATGTISDWDLSEEEAELWEEEDEFDE